MSRPAPHFIRPPTASRLISTADAMANLIQVRVPSLLIVLAFAFVATATAQVPGTSTRIVAGGVALIVPSIDGFQIPIGQERAASALVEPFIIPKNRFLAALLSSADVRLLAASGAPKLDEYFVLQIPRSIENRTVSLTEFQQLRREIREAQEAGQLRISPTVKRQLIKASKQISDRSGSKITIGITEPIPLGVFEDTERSIGMTLLSRVSTTSHEARTNDLMLSSSVVTVVRGKLLYINGACTFNSMADVSRCNSYTKAWLSKLHAANP